MFLTLRSKKANKEPLILSEEDIRENVVTYDDEGGGEEDTEAFDIAALRNPASSEQRRLRHRREVEPEAAWLVIGCRPRVGGSNLSASSCSVLDSNDIIHRVIRQKVVEADLDNRGPPYDSLQTYAYEGRGSLSGSISSLGLATALPELSYSDLEDWEPEAHTLARLFGEHILEHSP